MHTSDLIIIGAGPGGYTAADYAVKQGLNVVIIEAGQVGGTCLNAGCIPTKCLAHDAELLRNPLLGERGIDDTNFQRIQDRKNEVVGTLRQGVESILSQRGITLVRGKAEFVEPHVVAVSDEQYTAPNIIISTGSRAKLPPFAIDGMKSAHTKVLTSTELLNIDYVPRRLAIVGAGVVGMEFASAFESFGSHVEVYEFMKECLPMLDRDIAKRLRKSIEKRGVGFHMNYSVQSVDELEADVVLIATGRAANVEGLGLDRIGIACDKRGIVVGDDMQSNVKGVYAIGDVNGRVMLAHAAEWQGRRAINSILGVPDSIKFDIMPSAIFTYPEAACVGPTGDALKAAGTEFNTYKGFYRANGKAIATGETEGMVKVFATNDGIVRGCHAYGAHAADIVQEVASLMNMGVTVARLRDMIHTHPTLGEILIDAVK